MKKMDYTDEFLRKRKERQKRKIKRRRRAWFIFVLIMLIAVGVILSLTVLFPIKNLKFSGSKVYQSTQIEDASGIDVGDNLFNISKNNTLAKLRKKLPYIEDIEFKRTLPDTLEIKVTDAKKYACYKKGNEFFVISKNGWVLENSIEPFEDIVLIYADNVNLKVGQPVEYKNEKTKNQIDLLIRLLKENNLSIDYINVTDSINLKVGVEGRFEVIFGKETSIENKVKHLKTTIEALPENESGKINLSMWNSQKPEGTFVQNNTK